MDVQTFTGTTELIEQRIERLVRSRTGRVIRDLRVDVYGGSVVVSGHAPTYYVKQLATHAVFEAIEGFRLTNDIEVC